MPISSRGFFACLSFFILFGGSLAADKIYVLKYGESRYRTALVNSLSREKSVRLNWLIYLIETGSPVQYTLIDTGFSDPHEQKRFGVQRYRSLQALLKETGITPGQVRKVFLTHSHFDHAGNAPMLQNSTFYLAAGEYAQLADQSIVAFLRQKQQAGGLITLQGMQNQIDEWRVTLTAGHTPGSQVIRLKLNGKDYLFTGDECYFADACRQQIPLPKASAHSVSNNKAFLKTIGKHEIILTGHETNLTGGRWVSDAVYVIEP